MPSTHHVRHCNLSPTKPHYTHTTHHPTHPSYRLTRHPEHAQPPLQNHPFPPLPPVIPSHYSPLSPPLSTTSTSNFPPTPLLPLPSTTDTSQPRACHLRPPSVYACYHKPTPKLSAFVSLPSTARRQRRPPPHDCTSAHRRSLHVPTTLQPPARAVLP